MKKGILFDLDGTLWDSSQEVTDSWLLAMEDYPEMKPYVTKESMKSVMGKSMDEIGDILFAVLPQKERKELLYHCIAVENEYIERHGGRLFEDVVETLGRLKEKYHLSIVSNCQTGYIEAFLNYYDLNGYFDDFECYGATKRPKEENIRLVAQRNGLDAAVYVGDTQGDYDAASAAGMNFIHARTGYGTVKEAVPYVEKLSQLLDMVEDVMGVLRDSDVC